MDKKPLRDSTAYEMGRQDAYQCETLLSPEEFERTHPTVAMTSMTYHYYWRGYTYFSATQEESAR